MKYRIIIIFWLIFIFSMNLYSNVKLEANKINNRTNLFISEQKINIDDLINYNDMEYYIIEQNDKGNFDIYANDKYYEDLGLIPPKENQYYGRNNDELESLGSGPYLNISGNKSYYNLEYYINNFGTGTTIYYRSDDKEEMYHTQQYIQDNNFQNTEVTDYEISFSYSLIYFGMNIFFFVLLLLFLFVDINLYNKEIAISKTLGYSKIQIIKPKIIKQLLLSLTYFGVLILPLFLILYDRSMETKFVFYDTFFLILKFYIITNIIYYISFIFTTSKINVITALKGKMDVALINSISNLVNILSKILIIGLLVIIVIPTYQTIEVVHQYGKYIKGNESYERYFYDYDNPDLDLVSEYNKYEANGGIINTSLGNGRNYLDSENYQDRSQLIAVNSNYLNLIDFSEQLNDNQNYLLIPSTMKKSVKEIESMAQDYYEVSDYKIKYYESQPIYTYSPSSYITTSGYIYNPIMLVLNDISQTKQVDYVMNNFYYPNSDILDTSYTLTDEFFGYLYFVKHTVIVMMILFILFITIMMISTYYMLKSHLQVNGKEIAVKRILGYSNFKIYTTFYIFDFIFYIVGSIWIYASSRLILIPIWYLIVFVVIMIILNEFNRRIMINKSERDSIINIIKGEI